MNFFKKFYISLCIVIMIFGSFNINYLYAANNTKYNIVINCYTRKLGYYKDGYLVKTFDVATGKASSPTPKGKFKIVNKIKNRPYYSGGIKGGDPRNPLGDRWLGLGVGLTYGTTYGIHGNNNSNSIGNNVSGGCVRMHNNDIRWLYDQVPKGTEVIIYSSSESFTEAAKKYGITLKDDKELNSKQKDVLNKFKEFYIYGEMNNPIIDLSNKNSIIDTYSYTEDILKTSSSQGTTDRQAFLNAWNSLSNEEKSHKDMIKLWSDYEKIIAIVEAARDCNKFYEDVKSNATNIINDYNKANSYIQARDNAKKMYDKATKYGENTSNSPRMKDIYAKYLDASYFLEVAQYLKNRDVDNATQSMYKINNESMKSVAKNAIDNFSDIVGHWAEENIRGAMEKSWIATTNIFKPNKDITRSEFVAIINNALGYTEKSSISFKDVSSDKWYYDTICVAIKAGYISGYEDNTFRPDAPITREEAATIMTTVKNNKDSNLDKLSNYQDANKVSDWAKPSVEGAIEAGYMGAGGIKFNPKSNITKAEAIVTMERVVK